MFRKLAGLFVVGMLALTACSSNEGDDRSKADNAHNEMQESQPAANMNYSPTRETINFWVDTWDEPGKLSYVYLQNPDGEILGYYVLEGLPVSYCAQISPNQTYKSPGNGAGKRMMQAPANDGAYYSGGGSCDTYYGKDATTGAYVEYTAGLGINVLLFDQPLENDNGAEPLGDTKVEDIEE